jgi:hypothetical protein
MGNQNFTEPEEGVSYLQFFMRKDKSVGIIATELKTKLNFIMTRKQLQKIVENPGKPISIRKPYIPINGDGGNGQEMVAYFEQEECFIVYVGKIGRTIKNLRTDIATNGELEILIDINQVKSILNGVIAHEYAVDVANQREDERTDYLDGEVVLPEGKWFSEDEINEKTK